MPKMKCRCGDVLSYGEIPCPIEHLFISDTDFDKFVGKIEAENLYSTMKSFLKCPNCNRLWIFWNGFEEEPTEYIQAQ
ncbi:MULTISPECIES: hypothetical protein [Brevibacillus]|jgi:hypothetical protein|uniref:Uncharacterized protein n=1 Tax=Brevibacillus parabrevis TaxID=54914 RepID=A0A4Y3PWQ2_BREPA|nr:MULTISPECIES: hypothetical protein [Brevibacillus]MBU8710883.1 hypothetical protein [Brevibacillus parabrevis]MED2253553.1 hypothetical protein [Brevibacillus parabrevis]NRQ55398.1 hypothetical protein [Brevibacillus sp. HD1.4A]RNB90237.1 hypothetical protein EDM60_28120 [Brevibacillus parabrevis]WDV98023.1 hypothetical protein PSE45_14010 [Brevibacillus parabrevis]